MKTEELIKAYIESEKINKKKHHRLLNKKHLLKSLEEFLSERDVNEIHIKEALEYQGWIINRGTKDGSKYSVSAIQEYMSSASSFFEYLKSQKIILENPFKSIRRLKQELKIPRDIYSEQEMDTLLKSFRTWNKAEDMKEKSRLYRMHVISELMYSTGLRVSEAANLKTEDINLMNKTVLVREGKGGFTREAILNDYAKEVLNIYLNRMRDLIFTENNRKNGDLLFGLKEEVFTKLVNKELKAASERTGLKKMTSHGFRHAVGYHLLRSGCSIRHIQDILGHKNIKNTEIYTKVDKEDLKRVLDTYHPRKIKRIGNDL